MVHSTRLDLPKGHVDSGETELQCALRELEEETSIPAAAVELDATFRFTHKYRVRTQRTNNQWADKRLIIFLGWLKRPVEIRVSEHSGYRWIPWRPPHAIQEQTIDPLLAAVERHFAKLEQP